MNHINNFIPVISIDAIMIITVFMIDDVVDIIEGNKTVDVVYIGGGGHFTAPRLITIIVFEKLSILLKKIKNINIKIFK